ncbi:MAG TPA: ATP-binding protein, partial [Labilithrix sp.]|nr:ATP-binding protein [Labilithrix sp.]
DCERIGRSGYTDNIVDLLVRRIRRLPARASKLLELAAITGGAATERLLATIGRRDEASVRRDLAPVLRAGLLARSGDEYRFTNDVVQQTVYNLIPKAELPAYHARIGKVLLASTPESALSEHIYDIVEELNAGLELLSPPELDRLAELNLLAGRKARSAIAYDSATRYFATGVAILRTPSPDDPRAATAFELELELASCELLTGGLDAAKTRLDSLGARALTKRQLADLARLEIAAHVAASDHAGAVAVGLRCLRSFGIHWPQQPTDADVRAERERLDRVMGERAIEDLADLPLMVDPDALAMMDVFAVMKVAVLVTSLNLTCLLGCRMAETSLRFGNGPHSAFGYTSLAFVLFQYFDEWEQSYRFGKLGKQVGERLTLPAERGKICLDFALLSAWCRPVADSYGAFEHTLQLTRRWGDFTFATYAEFNLVAFLLLGGVPLAEVRRRIDDGVRYTRETRFSWGEQMLVYEERFVSCLEGKTAEFGILDGSGFDETRFEELADAKGDSLEMMRSWFSTWKLIARYMSGRYEEALAASTFALAHKNRNMVAPIFLGRFFTALTRAALLDGQLSPSERDTHLAMIREERATLEAWAERCPENFFPLYALVAAESARVEGDALEAQRLYERAIAAAREKGSVNVGGLALAMELAGKFYLRRGFARIADVYLSDARDNYQRWGAEGKVAQLEALYPRIERQLESVRVPTVTARHEQLDLLSVTKASQSIAEETEIDDLIRALMRAVLEQSVARRACLLLSHEGKLRMVAEARCTEEGIDATILSTTADTFTLVPEPIVNYVWRTREQVVLVDTSDTRKAGRIIPDEYRARFGPKCVMCCPIVRRGEPVGVLHLENDLATHAFTPPRLVALEVIGAQAAISLEIAIALREERRLRAAQERSEARFRRVSASNMIGIVFVDLSGRILDANDYVLDMLGYSRKCIETGSLRWDAITPPEYAASDARFVVALREGAAVPPFEKEYIRRDGSRVAVLIGVALLEEGSEEVVAFVIDITERRRLFLKEQQARAEAERVLHLREEFMAMAAHELRTPLAPLKLQLQMIAHHLGDDGERGLQLSRKHLAKMFTTADRQVDRLVRLVDDMLDVSKFGSGTLALEPEPVAVSELVSEVVERYRADAARANSSIVLLCACAAVASWDRHRIEQVIVNLLTNAIKYGLGQPIDVVVREHEDRIWLTVVDRGIGIREEDQARIFERFERAVSVDHYGGFGLGLYISLEIAKAHGGTISVDSRLGEGAKFTLELPLWPLSMHPAPTQVTTEPSSSSRS